MHRDPLLRLRSLQSADQLFAVAGDRAARRDGFSRVAGGEATQRQQALPLDKASEPCGLDRRRYGDAPGAGFKGGASGPLGAVPVPVGLDDRDQPGAWLEASADVTDVVADGGEVNVGPALSQLAQ
jgi:hypothetical protein